MAPWPTSSADRSATFDCGNILDTEILEGQVHGGVAQGLGQAMLEQIVYDPDSGQVLTGSFMDYAMPRAGHAAHAGAASRRRLHDEHGRREGALVNPERQLRQARWSTP
jgi:xanthine dehydrogenase molybdopterin-binding subunit B